MNNEKYIERSWQSYRKLIPEDAPDVQVIESRKAFYAGAAILFRALMLSLDPGDDPTERDLQRMTDLQTELDEFGQELDREIFGKQEH